MDILDTQSGTTANAKTSEETQRQRQKVHERSNNVICKGEAPWIQVLPSNWNAESESRDEFNYIENLPVSNATLASKHNAQSDDIACNEKAARPEPAVSPNPSSFQEELRLKALHEEENQLLHKNAELQSSIDVLRKEITYEKCTFLMSKLPLEVQMEGLRDDVSFLSKKKFDLNRKLLAIQLGRIGEI